jgi:hypothetical protein
MASARAAADAGPAAVRIYPAVVVRGTELETMYREGRYSPLTMEQAVALCASMHRVFTERGIAVIRTGLHPVRPGRADAIVAGPYHPSFGFLVKSRVRRDAAEREIRRAAASFPGKPAGCTLTVPEDEIGEYIGHRRENVLYLEKLYGLRDLRFRPGQVRSPEVAR